ncbi:hypothetical protein BKI52_44885 [marine bacterium AO1-C]|nr:hypothetical protein BKI52_44885 [marine bacterium AO1-C]
MDNQEFDDIIKGKLENFQDTGSYNEGALDNLLDNLPNAGGGAAGSLPTWMQSAWWPIGIAASVLFNLLLVFLVWNQRQTVRDMQQEIRSMKTRSAVVDTVVISKTDTIFISTKNTSTQYNQTQAGLWNRSPYGAYPNSNRWLGGTNKLPRTKQRIVYVPVPVSNNNYQKYLSGQGFNPASNQKISGNTNPNNSKQGIVYVPVPVSNKAYQKYLSGQGFDPASNQKISGNANSLPDAKKDTKKSDNGSGKTTPPITNNAFSEEEKKELLASMSAVDSIQLLSNMTNDPLRDDWQITMEKIPEKRPKIKRKAKRAFWSNIGFQLGVTAGASTPLIDLGETDLVIPLGAKAEVSFGERWRFHTGIDFYTFEQEISSLPANQNNTERYPDLNTSEELKEIKTSANVLDVPLQLRYTFGTRFSNIKPYIGVGVLARRMSRLQVSYEYDEEEANALFMQNSPWQISHYQGVLGAEIFLQRNINLQLNAYYNGGFEALGGNNNYFNNLGFSAGLFFTLK